MNRYLSALERLHGRAVAEDCAENANAVEWQDPYFNFTWITPHLAIGGAVPMEAVPWLAETESLKAVVDLRAEARDDAELLERHGMAFLHLPTDDHHPVTQSMLDEGVAFATERTARDQRVLVHCREGVGRSALLGLCILVDQGFEPMAALELAKDRRWQVSPSPAQYDAWVEWLTRRGHAAPDFDSFGKIAYRHLFNR